jgi:hypothetical protein
MSTGDTQPEVVKWVYTEPVSAFMSNGDTQQVVIKWVR